MKVRPMTIRQPGGDLGAKRSYVPPRDVSNGGCCPKCGRFNSAEHSKTVGLTRVQYRYCDCGQSYQTTASLGPSNPLEI